MVNYSLLLLIPAVRSDVCLHALRRPAVVRLLGGHLRGGVREAGRAGHLAGLIRLLVRVHLLEGGGLDVAGEGAAVGGGQVSGATVNLVSGVNAGRLAGLLLLLGSLLLFVRGSARCGGRVSLREVIYTRLGAVLPVHRAGGGQLRWSVDWSGIGHIFGEPTSADVAVFVTADLVVTISGILKEEKKRSFHHSGWCLSLSLEDFQVTSICFTLMSDLSSSSSSRRSLCSVRDVPGDSLLLGA